jgi:hypothetical protein
MGGQGEGWRLLILAVGLQGGGKAIEQANIVALASHEQTVEPFFIRQPG